MHQLPDELKSKIRPITNGSEIDFAVESDLCPPDTTDTRWLITAGKRLYVISPDHGDLNVHFDASIDELTDIRSEPMVGNGCLIANYKGEYIQLIRYSNSRAKEFGHTARRLEAISKGKEPPEVTEEDVTRRCKKCGFPLEAGSKVCPNCVNNSRAVKRLLGYVKPYRKMTTVAATLMVVAKGLGTAGPFLTKILIDKVFEKQGASAIHFARSSRMHDLGLIVLVLIVTQVLSSVLTIFQARIAARLGSGMVHDIRMQLYASMQRLTVGFFDKRQTGAVISRVSQDTNALQEFLSFDIQFVISNVLLLVLVLGIMFQQNARLAALTLLPMPIALLAATLAFKRIRWMYRRVWQRWSKLHGLMSDALQGLRVVKAFAQEDKEVSRFGRRSEALFVANMQAEQTWTTLLPIFWFFLTSGQFIVWYVGGRMVIDGQLSVGTLLMFIGYNAMLYGPLQIVSRMWDWIGRCLAAAERVFEVMDAQYEEPDKDTKIRMPEIKGRVTFKNMTFGYDKNRPVLHEIDLDVKPGEMIGLVGHSGAGKSTLINLITRFYDAQEGAIEIDGVDIRDIRLEDLRTQIGIVPQESFLFSGTIAENIAYSKKDATPEEIIRAAKAANSHDFIVNFPDGYETQVGERGQSLSGGERQRIAIARAILHDPKILILDEATSAVDTVTEKQIQEALSRLVKDRTTFAIAHRLSTLRNADRLLVLDQGKQAELGTHEELMEANGTYAKLINMQSELSTLVAVGG